MTCFVTPASARRAAYLLASRENHPPAAGYWPVDRFPVSAGELERRELVDCIAERLGTAGNGPAEVAICLRLLDHLSQPALATATLRLQ